MLPDRSGRAADSRGKLRAMRRKAFIPEEKFPKWEHLQAR